MIIVRSTLRPSYQRPSQALAYYESNISKNGSIDALYYLADDVAKSYENHEGGSAQQNDAHLIEFLGAYSYCRLFQ